MRNSVDMSRLAPPQAFLESPEQNRCESLKNTASSLEPACRPIFHLEPRNCGHNPKLSQIPEISLQTSSNFGSVSQHTCRRNAAVPPPSGSLKERGQMFGGYSKSEMNPLGSFTHMFIFGDLDRAFFILLSHPLHHPSPPAPPPCSISSLGRSFNHRKGSWSSQFHETQQWRVLSKIDSLLKWPRHAGQELQEPQGVKDLA